MAYNVKLMRGGVAHAVYPCTHYEVTDFVYLLPKREEKGLRITLCPDGPILELPRDGESVYVTTQNGGHNVDALHWPPRKKQANAPQP